MARRGRPARGRAPGRHAPATAPSRPPAPAAAPPPLGRRTTFEAQIGFALGVLAMFVLPLAYQWTLRPATNPFGSDGAVVIVEAAGIAAAAIALLLGRRARASGARSSGAIWAPRLGAAAMVGYVMTLVLLASRGA